MTSQEGGQIGKSGRASDLRARVVSALVLAIVVLALTWFGGFPYRLLACVIAAAVLFEWLAMMRTADNRSHLLVVSGVLAAVLLILILGLPTAHVLIGLAAAVAIACVHALVGKHGWWPAAGLAYAGLSAISLAAVRSDDAPGLAATLFLFAVVWVTDVMAYFAGKTFGGPKLAPAISPGKTWSGAIGGAVCGAAAGAVAALVVDASFGIGIMILVALGLSLISQAGDLFESSLKRRFLVKDSSRLIPGHGGVMDRVDGLVASAFALMLLGMALAGLDAPARGLFAG